MEERKQTAVQWLVYQLNLSSDGWMGDLINQAKEMEKEQQLKYQLFIGKVMEIIGYETTIELLRECNETFKSE